MMLYILYILFTVFYVSMGYGILKEFKRELKLRRVYRFYIFFLWPLVLLQGVFGLIYEILTED